jgi:hypothetical protein
MTAPQGGSAHELQYAFARGSLQTMFSHKVGAEPYDTGIPVYAATFWRIFTGVGRDRRDCGLT